MKGVDRLSHVDIPCAPKIMSAKDCRPTRPNQKQIWSAAACRRF